MTEVLRELKTDAATGALLRALRNDIPDSVHVLNVIQTIIRWRRLGCLGDEITSSVYRMADEGDSDEGPATVLVVTSMALVRFPIIVVHTTDHSCSALRRMLKYTAYIPWDKVKASHEMCFESIHERCIPSLEDEMRSRGACSPSFCWTHKMFMPRDQAAQLDGSSFSLPPGLCLRPLDTRHARIVNEWWPYRSDTSEELIGATIKRQRGLCWGVFAEDGDADCDPVAWVLGEWYGGLGMLHTMDSHRRQGLAVSVTKAACKAHAEIGLDVHCNIVYPNPASAFTLSKVGFKQICECAWVSFHPQSDSV